MRKINIYVDGSVVQSLDGETRFAIALNTTTPL